MKQPISFIVIDPYSREIRQQLIEPGNLAGYYGAIGRSCRSIQVIYPDGLGGMDGVYADEEALIHGQHFAGFMINDTPVLGRGIVVGTDSEGNTIAPATNPEAVAKLVQWLVVA